MKLYNSLLEKYPIRTKAVTSGSLFSLGDALTQFSTPQPIQSSRRNSSIGSVTWTSSQWVWDTSALAFIFGTASCCQECRQQSSRTCQRRWRCSARWRSTNWSSRLSLWHSSSRLTRSWQTAISNPGRRESRPARISINRWWSTTGRSGLWPLPLISGSCLCSTRSCSPTSSDCSGIWSCPSSPGNDSSPFLEKYSSQRPTHPLPSAPSSKPPILWPVVKEKRWDWMMGFIIAELFYNTQVCYIVLGDCEGGIIRYRWKQIIKISVRGIFFARVRVCLGSMLTRSRCTLSAGFFCGYSRR